MSTTVLTGQAPTNLGPLTTTFTPPPACTVAVGAGPGGVLDGPEKNAALLGQGCSAGLAWDATSCWPATSQGVEGAKQPRLKGWGFYSPGLHCPVGYATACSAMGGTGGESGWPVQFQLGEGETAVGCCPSGYGCANIHGQTCTMVATSTTIQTVTCDGSKSGDFGFLAIPDASASITALSLFAPMIQINWRSSDRPETTTTELTATSTSARDRLTMSGTKTVDTAAASGEETLILAPGDGTDTEPLDVDFGWDTRTSESSQRPSDNGSNNNNEGLSSGARVAIGAAGSAVLMAVVMCCLFYCWRRRKNRREERELHRLYGLRHAMNPGADFTSKDDMPGWYRGQRLLTPPNRYSGVSAWAPSMRSVERPVPAVPYYRPYRP